MNIRKFQKRNFRGRSATKSAVGSASTRNSYRISIVISRAGRAKGLFGFESNLSSKCAAPVTFHFTEARYLI